MALKNNKNLGQHWLKNRDILDAIADAAMLDAPDDPEPLMKQPLCLEIGPGLGTLTSSLLRRFPRVLAVEFDQKLAQNLPNSFPGTSLDVVHQDFLQFDLASIKEPYVVAANIPYYITSPIITKLLTAPAPPLKVVLLIQKEVADRICATTGSHTFLSVATQSRATVTRDMNVPRDFFTPPPKVDSAVIILQPHAPFLSDAELKLVKLGFSNPRKKLIKNLPFDKDLILQVVPPNARPADLSLEDWKTLAQKLKIS